MHDLYLDNNGRTPVDRRVVQAVAPFLTDYFGNPSARHGAGQACHAAIENARQAVAALMRCQPDEVVFTSGGSEADNTAVHSAVAGRGGRGHIICSACEHDAVLQPIAEWERRGCTVTRLEPGGCGFISPEKVRAALRPDTVLVSIMGANNETGAIQPVEAIAQVLRSHPALFHVDAVQCAGKVPLPHPQAGIDYMAISGHKFGAPPGIGALMVRNGAPFLPLIVGGGQENKRRAGTENTPGIVGLGEAAKQALQIDDRERAEMAAVRDALQNRIRQTWGADVMVLCDRALRVPNTLLVAFRGINGRTLQEFLAGHGISVGTGSACSCLKEFKPSATIQSMHVPPEFAAGTMRLSLNRYQTPRYGFTLQRFDPLFQLLEVFLRQNRSATAPAGVPAARRQLPMMRIGS